jgi:predicted metal-dependent phosphoesterase TrpH
MKIDLHVHTSKLSPDSRMAPEDAILKAKDLGLDGICLTEHDRAWELSDIVELREKYNFPVFRGVEVMVRERGEILVFGLNINFVTVVDIKMLRNMVAEAGGFMIVAHPFRGFPCSTITDFNIAAEIVMKKAIFDKVDAIEGYNGRNLEGNNILACELAHKLGLHFTGGSDAHFSNELGRCVTIFRKNIRNDGELLEELKAGRFHGESNHSLKS